MATRYGMPMPERRGKQLQIHVFSKLAEHSTDEQSQSDLEKETKSKFRRNVSSLVEGSRLEMLKQQFTNLSDV